MKKLALVLLSVTFHFSFAMAQNSVILKNGQKINGKVVSLVNGVVELNNNQAVSTIKVSEISRIIFSDPSDKSLANNEELGEKEFLTGSTFIRYKVADRNLVKPPSVANLTQKKGTVVVAVTVNKYGNVVKAVPGAAGSSTTDEYLLAKAKQAAESALFDNVPTAPLEQTGYITITF